MSLAHTFQVCFSHSTAQMMIDFSQCVDFVLLGWILEDKSAKV